MVNIIENNNEEVVNMTRSSGVIQNVLINSMAEASKDLANLHRSVTSPNGDYFNSALLHALRKRLDGDQLEEFRKKANVFEHERHLHKFLYFGLVLELDVDGVKIYERTSSGEEALNAMREMESKIGLDKARDIYKCGLGRASIEFFLKLYQGERFFLSKFMNRSLEIKYKKNKILKKFNLPIGAEGISVIKKLSDSGLLICDENYFYLEIIRARSFYQYLKRLYKILEDNG